MCILSYVVSDPKQIFSVENICRYSVKKDGRTHRIKSSDPEAGALEGFLCFESGASNHELLRFIASTLPVVFLMGRFNFRGTITIGSEMIDPPQKLQSDNKMTRDRLRFTEQDVLVLL